MTAKRLTVLLSMISATALADSKPVVSFTLDNDGIFGVDQDYTNGLFLSYTSQQIPQGLESTLFSLSGPDTQSVDKYQFLIGHKMWTPEDLTADYPVKNDRAYAGFLHTEVNYLTLTNNRSVRYNFTVGTVGSNSLSEQAQSLVHAITGSTEPEGWDYQIEEGFRLNIGYRNHSTLIRQPIGTNQWDLLALTEANAGNFRSDLSHGVLFRWGSQLENSIGSVNIEVENPFNPGAIARNGESWFLYAGFKGRYRLNDITVSGDRGNIDDQSEYEVTLANWQAVATSGIAWHNRRFGGSLSFSIKTQDYEEASSQINGSASFNIFHYF